MTTVALFQNKDILAYLQAKNGLVDHRPWWFVYIPQTIPYVVRTQLADILQPEAAISVSKEEDEGDYDSRMLLALQRFERSEGFHRCRFVSGHFKAFQIDKVPGLAKVRLMTVMRDPLQRLLRDFAAQNAAKRERGTPEAFLEFAKNPANQNLLLQYLCPKRIWKPQECIDFIENRFDFVGIAEDIPMTIKLFYAIHGARPSVLVKETRGGVGGLGREDLSSDLIRTVSLINALDYDIFRWFHDRFVSLKKEFFAMSDNGDIFKALTYRAQDRKRYGPAQRAEDNEAVI